MFTIEYSSLRSSAAVTLRSSIAPNVVWRTARSIAWASASPMSGRTALTARTNSGTLSIEAARTHAAAGSLTIDYRVGAGEQLPVEDGMFDVAYCCDVLEHVSDLDRVISETARVLKPGGLYLFDTVNRTLQSKLVAIKIAQEWPLTRVVDTPMHDWQMFIKPAELARALHRHRLHLGEIAGLGPRAKMPTCGRPARPVSGRAVPVGGPGVMAYCGYCRRGWPSTL